MEIVGGERETSWPTLDGSSLSLSSSSRYPFFIERSIVEPDPVLQTDLSLPGWEKSVVVVVSLDLVEEARYTHCRPVIDDQKQGGCYKLECLLLLARNTCQYRGNLRTEWTCPKKMLLKKKKRRTWVTMVVNDGSPDPFSPQERISNNKILETVNGKYVKMKSSILFICIMFMIAEKFLCRSIFFSLINYYLPAGK